jgi:hypothetical protein
MPPLGLEDQPQAKPSGTQSRGGAKAPRPQGTDCQVEAWKLYSNGHLAVGLLLQKNVKLTPCEVMELQGQLAALGFYKGEPTGVFDARTEAAHKQYRKSMMQGLNFSSTPAIMDEVASIAEAEAAAGVKEEGKNAGARVEEYQKAAAHCGKGSAWCAAFVCWCFARAAEENLAHFALPKEAAAFRFEDWAVAERTKGVYLLDPEDVTVRRGDLVVFDFSHIGICVESEDASGKFQSVEGNTAPSGGTAKQREGDGVYKKSQTRAKLRSIVRVQYPTIEWLPFQYA